MSDNQIIEIVKIFGVTFVSCATAMGILKFLQYAKDGYDEENTTKLENLIDFKLSKHESRIVDRVVQKVGSKLTQPA